jgi:hypothetical protein
MECPLEWAFCILKHPPNSRGKITLENMPSDYTKNWSKSCARKCPWKLNLVSFRGFYCWSVDHAYNSSSSVLQHWSLCLLSKWLRCICLLSYVHSSHSRPFSIELAILSWGMRYTMFQAPYSTHVPDVCQSKTAVGQFFYT